jgi:uncharacterized protein (UPF0303 family)
MSASEDITLIERQEQVLRFKKFDEADAWSLGKLMHKTAAKRSLALVLDIRIGNRRMFYACMPGTTQDNETWVQRKINAVMRFHKSSYRLGRECEHLKRPFDMSRGIDTTEYTNAGGSFPIHIIGTGVVGTVTVSGIPQRDDHGFVVEAIAQHLGLNYAEIALPAE